MNQEEVWDRIAGAWKDFRHYSQDHILEFLDGKRGRVLDLACGSGRNAPAGEGKGIRNQESGELEFYGVDFSAKMVELAGERGYVEVKKGDVSEVPYEDGFFDCVIFSAALHCVEGVDKRRKALEECYRVLRSGGEMVISVWGRGSDRVKNKPKECFVPWTPEGGKVERYTYVYDFDELKGELEEVGFRVLKGWEDKNICFVVGKA